MLAASLVAVLPDRNAASGPSSTAAASTDNAVAQAVLATRAPLGIEASPLLNGSKLITTVRWRSGVLRWSGRAMRRSAQSAVVALCRPRR